MGIIRTGTCFAAFMASPAIAGTDAEGTQTARSFLEAVATNPSASNAFVTSDAVIIAGDIGLPFSDFLREVRPRLKELATCRVTTLQSKPLPSGVDFSSEDSPPRFRGAKITLVEGAYSCGGSKRSNKDIRVSLVLKDGRVVQFAMESMN